MLLQALQQIKSEWALAPVLSWLAGAAWAVLTFFIAPVLALEDVGVREGMRRSVELVRKRWGEGVAGATNIALVVIAVMLPAMLVSGFVAPFVFADPSSRWCRWSPSRSPASWPWGS